MQGVNQDVGTRFRVESSNGTYESTVLAVAIGIFGRPNKPKDYRLLPSLKERLLFDMTSFLIQNENVLVIGGGDTAAEYGEYLHRQLRRARHEAYVHARFGLQREAPSRVSNWCVKEFAAACLTFRQLKQRRLTSLAAKVNF